MAEIEVVCPKCGTRYGIDEKSLGRRARCKRCDTRLVLASSVATPEHDAGAGSIETREDDTAPASTRKTTEDDVPAVWKPGDVILELYEVKEVLGEGGFGTVYRVHHRGWNVDLAVKCPRPDKFRTDREKERFVRECQTWVDLGLHPHTVSCHYVRTLGGIPRVFAEYVEGGTLKEWIDEGRLPPSPSGRGAGGEGGGAFDLKTTLDLAIQISWGMAFAHSKGLVHRDLKPANVLVTSDGTAKVTDFGLARHGVAPAEGPPDAPRPVSVQVSTGAGTPGYAAPEQVSAGRTVDHRADVFAFGVTLWRMLGGRITWADDLRKSVIAGHAVRALLKRGEPAGLPSSLTDLILRCLEPEPDDRWPDFAAVSQQLRAIYGQEAGEEYARLEAHAVNLLADGLNNRAVSLLDVAQGKTGEESQGLIERSLELFDEALQCDPLHVQATYNRGIELWRGGRVTDTLVLTQLEEVRKTRPDSWEAGYCLGLVHLERDDAESAIEALEEAVRLGGSSEVHHAMAWARALRCVRTFEAHSRGVNSVCLSADGRWALSGSNDRMLRLWEVSTGRCVRTFEEHTDGVNSVCLSANSRWALSGSDDKTLRLWEVSTGRCVRMFRGHTSGVNSVCLSADGRWALSGSGELLGGEDNTLRLWEVSTGRCVRTFGGHASGVRSVCLSADGRWALSGSDDKTLRLWEVSTGRCVRTFRGHASRVRSVCLSADCRWALSASRDDTLRLWEVSTGRCVRTFEGHTGDVTSVCLSADGRWALSGGKDKTLRLWGVSTGRCARTFEAHGGAVTSVCLSADGRWALSGSADQALRLWDLRPATAPSRPLAGSRVVCRVRGAGEAAQVQAEFTDLMRMAQAAVEAADYHKVLDLVRQARLLPGHERSKEALNLQQTAACHSVRKAFRAAWCTRMFEGHTSGVNSVCLSADGRWALSGSGELLGGEDNTLRLWEVSTGRCVRTFEEHDKVTNVCLSADGHWALSVVDALFRDKLSSWKVSTGRCVRTFGSYVGSGCLCLSVDGRWALSEGKSYDDSLRLWKVSTGRCVRKFEWHSGGVNSVCLSADGRWALSGGDDATLRLWEVSTGRCVRTFEGHGGAVTSVCLSADVRWALSGSKDRSLRLWEVSTGCCVRAFEEYYGGVTSVCLSADGRWALSGTSHYGGADNTVRLWEVSTGRCLRTFEGHTEAVTSVCLSADGRSALSGSHDRTLRLWQLDWEYEFPGWADWDEGARPYLQSFLTLRSRRKRLLRGWKRPKWSDKDFNQLLIELQHRGYGWLRPEGVRRKLEEMTANWQGPPPMPSEENE